MNHIMHSYMENKTKTLANYLPEKSLLILFSKWYQQAVNCRIYNESETKTKADFEKHALFFTQEQKINVRILSSEADSTETITVHIR